MNTPLSHTSLKAIVVIPARMRSSRFTGKVLHKILGRPMVDWVYRAAQRAKGFSGVWIASGDEEVIKYCQANGFDCIRTYLKHASGTDRVAEAVQQLPCDIVINLQGDEPTIEPIALEALLSAFIDPMVRMATLAGPIASQADLDDPNVVKVIADCKGVALDFYRRDIHRGAPKNASKAWPRVHVGVYAFRRDALLEFTGMPASVSENEQRLEQCRALDAGWQIRVIESDWHGCGVDTPADAVRAAEILKAVDYV